MPSIIGRMWIHLTNLVRRDQGASLVEYAMMLGLIAFVCFAAITYTGERNNDNMSSSASKIATAQAN